MIKYSKLILNELENIDVKNNYLSPVWILKVEKIYHNGRFYLKTYLFQNVSDITINEIVFNVTYNQKTHESKVFRFTKAESYLNDTVFGCLIELPEDYKDEEYEIIIDSSVINNQFVDYSKSIKGLLSFNLGTYDEKKVQLLRDNIQNFTVFPEIKKEYWRCCCGKHNSRDQVECLNCGFSLNKIKEIIDKGIDVISFELLVRKFPFKFVPNKSFEEAYNEYRITLKQSFNISDDLINSYFDQEIELNKYIQIEKERDLELAESKIRVKRLRFIQFSILLVILIILSIVVRLNWNNIRIYTAEKHFESGEFDEAKQIYEEVDSKKFSENIAVCEMEIALLLLEEKEYKAAYDLSRKNYVKTHDPKYKEIYIEIKYQYAISLGGLREGVIMLLDLESYKDAKYIALKYIVDDYLINLKKYLSNDSSYSFLTTGTKYSDTKILFNELRDFDSLSGYLLEWQFFQYTLEGKWSDYKGNYYKHNSEGTTQFSVPFSVKQRGSYKYYYYYDDGYYYGNDKPSLRILNLKLLNYNKLQICNLNYDCVTLNRE